MILSYLSPVFFGGRLVLTLPKGIAKNAWKRSKAPFSNGPMRQALGGLATLKASKGNRLKNCHVKKETSMNIVHKQINILQGFHDVTLTNTFQRV